MLISHPNPPLAATPRPTLPTPYSLVQGQRTVPTKNVYNLFEKVCVTYGGQMACRGLASLGCQYFINMDYQPANRKATPDFLVTVINPNVRTARGGTRTVRPGPHMNFRRIEYNGDFLLEGWCSLFVRHPFSHFYFISPDSSSLQCHSVCRSELRV